MHTCVVGMTCMYNSTTCIQKILISFLCTVAKRAIASVCILGVVGMTCTVPHMYPLYFIFYQKNKKKIIFKNFKKILKYKICIHVRVYMYYTYMYTCTCIIKLIKYEHTLTLHFRQNIPPPRKHRVGKLEDKNDICLANSAKDAKPGFAYFCSFTKLQSSIFQFSHAMFVGALVLDKIYNYPLEIIQYINIY